MSAMEAKQRLEAELIGRAHTYVSLIESCLSELPFTEVVEVARGKRHSLHPRFLQHGQDVTLPCAGGIYLVYNKDQDTPFYCGETDNLQRRITYHFSNRKDAITNSTLKKHLPKDSRDLQSMCDTLHFKYIEVPFARADVEKHFHHKYSINTAK